MENTIKVLLRKPYLVFLGTAQSTNEAKTGFGLVEWARENVIGQWRSGPGTISLGIDDLDFATACAHGAQTLIVGIAPIGGRIPSDWKAVFLQALEAGLDVAAGLHDKLADDADLVSAAQHHGRRLVDIRVPPARLPVGTGVPRSGNRVLTVGTDSAVGKKYTALALAAELRARRVSAAFRATGQTGIMIAGEGIPIDAVVSDFLAGAAECLSPASASDHWDIVEGQGSLFHPGYAAVTLGLLHGTQPQHLVLCHDPSRATIADYPGYATPRLDDAIQTYLAAARLTSPGVQISGIALNTSSLTEREAQQLLERTEREQGIPCVDPIRTGVVSIVRKLLE